MLFNDAIQRKSPNLKSQKNRKGDTERRYAKIYTFSK